MHIKTESVSNEVEKGAACIVVLKWDKLYGDLIRHQIWEIWPDATVCVFQRGFAALSCIQETKPDLFITGVRIEDMDGLEHLEPFIERDLPILVVTSLHDTRTYNLLREVRCDGLYDGFVEGLDNLAVALRQVMRHQFYVSPTMAPYMKKPRNVTLDALTETEQIVLSVIGDGSDDMEASARLGSSPATINTHRKSIMKKLNLHHRGAVMLHALQHGYVHVTPQGVYRPGFERRIQKMTQAKGGGGAVSAIGNT